MDHYIQFMVLCDNTTCLSFLNNTSFYKHLFVVSFYLSCFAIHSLCTTSIYYSSFYTSCIMLLHLLFYSFLYTNGPYAAGAASDILLDKHSTNAVLLLIRYTRVVVLYK